MLAASRLPFPCSLALWAYLHNSHSLFGLLSIPKKSTNLCLWTKNPNHLLFGSKHYETSEGKTFWIFYRSSDTISSTFWIYQKSSDTALSSTYRVSFIIDHIEFTSYHFLFFWTIQKTFFLYGEIMKEKDFFIWHSWIMFLSKNAFDVKHLEYVYYLIGIPGIIKVVSGSFEIRWWISIEALKLKLFC